MSGILSNLLCCAAARNNFQEDMAMRKRNSEKDQRRKIQSIIHYKASVAMFEKWLSDGLITPEDFITVEKIVTAKYGLSPHSIYRRYTLKTAVVT